MTTFTSTSTSTTAEWLATDDRSIESDGDRPYLTDDELFGSIGGPSPDLGSSWMYDDWSGDWADDMADSLTRTNNVAYVVVASRPSPSDWLTLKSMVRSEAIMRSHVDDDGAPRYFNISLVTDRKAVRLTVLLVTDMPRTDGQDQILPNPYGRDKTNPEGTTAPEFNRSCYIIHSGECVRVSRARDARKADKRRKGNANVAWSDWDNSAQRPATEFSVANLEPKSEWTPNVAEAGSQRMAHSLQVHMAIRNRPPIGETESADDMIG